MTVKTTVVGSGPGGYMAALRMAQLGAKVTVVERDRIGGVCLNWGCIPTKALLTSAEAVDNIKSAQSLGIILNEAPKVDMKKIVYRKNKIIENQAKGILELLSRNNISLLSGSACISSAGHLEIKTSKGQYQQANWDRLILAPGSSILELPAAPFDHEKILSSTDALNLEYVPNTILIVGGGVIGCEFATLYAQLGAKVTIVEAMDRLLPLPGVDADCSRLLHREMKKQNIAVITDTTVISCTKSNQNLEIQLGPSEWTSSEKKKKDFQGKLWVDVAVVCIGRSPNTSGLGLEAIGIERDQKGWIITDNKMRTNVENIYAIGDVLGPGRIMLAHAAMAEASVAAENALDHSKRFMNYEAVPGAIFTKPEIANVGLSEEQAREKGLDFRCYSTLFRILGKSQATGELAGQGKLISDPGNGKILGIHLIGPRATDLISEATLAINQGCTVKDLASTIHPHPTFSEIIFELSHKAMDNPVHG